MAKLIGWIVGAAFGVLVGLGIIYVVGETVEIVTDYQANQ